MEQGAKRRLFRVLGIFLLSLGGLLVLVWLIHPPCLILRTTGFYCAGCGGQRMLWALSRGDFSAAFGYNPFLFVSLPFLMAYGLAEAVRYVRGRQALCHKRWMRIVLLLYVLLAVAFMILRNLEAFSFLAP